MSTDEPLRMAPLWRPLLADPCRKCGSRDLHGEFGRQVGTPSPRPMVLALDVRCGACGEVEGRVRIDPDQVDARWRELVKLGMELAELEGRGEFESEGFQERATKIALESVRLLGLMVDERDRLCRELGMED